MNRNTNLEALVEAASGAHPIPEQEADAPVAAAEATHDPNITDAYSPKNSNGHLLVTGQDEEQFHVMDESEVATEEAIAASALVKCSTMKGSHVDAGTSPGSKKLPEGKVHAKKRKYGDSSEYRSLKHGRLKDSGSSSKQEGKRRFSLVGDFSLKKHSNKTDEMKWSKISLTAKPSSLSPLDYEKHSSFGKKKLDNPIASFKPSSFVKKSSNIRKKSSFQYLLPPLFVANTEKSSVCITPNIIRQMASSERLDVFNRKTGKVMRGKDSISLKTLHSTIQNHSEYEVLLPEVSREISSKVNSITFQSSRTSVKIGRAHV
jgi:hypothetical protein